MGFFQKATLNQRFMTPVYVRTKSAVSQIPIYLTYHQKSQGLRKSNSTTLDVFYFMCGSKKYRRLFSYQIFSHIKRTRNQYYKSLNDVLHI